MSFNWEVKTLDEVCEKITDGSHYSPKSVENGKPMASVKDLIRDGIDLMGAKHISIEDYEMLVKQGCKPEIGDVLIAKDGNSALDTVCNIKESLEVVLLSSIAILRPNKEQLNSDFLKYYLSSKSTINYMKKNFISGAAIPRVILKDFKKVEIKLPPMDIQNKISKVLGSLDIKITLNVKINQTLEQMAQAIFKSWFVDFDPVKAKMMAFEKGGAEWDATRAAMRVISGKTNEELEQFKQKHPEKYDELKTTAELFPSAMQDSELGEIPEGWEVKELDEIFEIGIGKTPPRKENYWFSTNKNDITWISIKDLGNAGSYILKSAEMLTKDAIDKFNIKIIPKNTVVLSFKLTVGRSAITYHDMVSNEAIAHFKIKENSDVSTEYLFFYLRSFNFNTLGSTSSIAIAVNSKTIKRIKIIVPKNEILEKFQINAKSILDEIKNNQEEIENLTQLRDTLLPKLLSGELNLDEVEI